MKALIIAEKPSVASDIAKVLGCPKAGDDQFENDQYVVSSALGHLLELSCPEKYEVKRGKWSLDNLPVLPPQFELKPIEKTKKRLTALAKLIRRKDVGLLINACDAGREGELIFRYIVQATKAKQPIERLWLQSMTPGAIREAFNHLRTDADMQTLAQAAKSRSEADWLVGINGTRAMTAFNSRAGGFFLTTVGRVQTPTLAIVVRRENEIRAFRPRDYWEVHADFGIPAGTYEGRWFDPKFQKNAAQPDLKPERIFDQAKAQAIVARCQGKTGTVTETSRRTTQLSPLLFDLTSLQREANNKFGFSAKTTLALAQALYEKHKALTYPRTDARALPEDYLDTVRQTLRMVGSSHYGALANRILEEDWVKPNRRIFDNTKISDHFAIIPTLQPPKGALTEAEAKVYDLVVRRFMAVFYPAAIYDVTTRITTVGEDQFKTEGKVLVSPGWLEVYGRTQAANDSLVPLNNAKQAQVQAIEAQAQQTRPPARYTEATLLSAMEGAGKLVTEGELRDAMGERGLGTPATRAAIIENLIDQKYMVREGRELRPTPKAQQLLTLISGLGIGALSDPKLTGEWEYKLAQIEKGALTRDQFMNEIRGMTTRIVDAAKNNQAGDVPVQNPVHLQHRCPKCGGEIVENYRFFACTTPNCDFAIPKHVAGRTFDPAEVEELLEHGEIGPLTGFRSKMGRPFQAALKLNPSTWKVEFDFGNDEGEQPTAAEIDALPVVGKCPKCGGRVVQGPAAYFCEHANGDKKTCDFRCGRMILQQPISPEEMTKILETGKSSLLTDFVSNRNHRKFKAFLTLDKATGKVGFEFPPREGAAGKTTTRKKSATAAAKTSAAKTTTKRRSTTKKSA